MVSRCGQRQPHYRLPGEMERRQQRRAILWHVHQMPNHWFEERQDIFFHSLRPQRCRWSAASAAVTAIPDKTPTAPVNVTVEGGNARAAITWSPIDGDFSEVDNYMVTVSGVGVLQTKETGNTTTKLSFIFNNDSISDGTLVTATVKAHNRAGWSRNPGLQSPRPSGVTPMLHPLSLPMTTYQQ